MVQISRITGGCDRCVAHHAWKVACERFTCPPPGDSSTSHGGSTPVTAGRTGLTLSGRLAGVIVLGADRDSVGRAAGGGPTGGAEPHTDLSRGRAEPSPSSVALAAVA